MSVRIIAESRPIRRYRKKEGAAPVTGPTAWQELIEAAAMVGMSESEFWDSTPRYFAARQKAYIQQERRQWERARFIGWLAVLPHVGKKSGGLSAKKLFQFEWEVEKPVFEPFNHEEMKSFELDAIAILEKQLGIKLESQYADN